MNEQFKKQLEESSKLILTLPWENKDFYGNFLAQTYYFVCHSTRLLAKSMSYFGQDKESLYIRFKNHLSEENAHEKIALSDLRKVGHDITDFPEMGVTRSFYECQYHKIERTQGTSLLGYILYLEAVAVYSYPAIIEKLYMHYGKSGSQFLKVHIEEDPDHISKAVLHIEELPQKEKDEIWLNFNQTAEIYCLILQQVAQTAGKKLNEYQKVA